MKKFLLVFLAFTFIFSASLPAAADTKGGSSITLNVFNWGEYISDGSDGSLDVNAEFEKYYEEKYSVKMTVNYSNFDTNETMYSKLKAGGANYDIIIPSDYMISRLIKEDMLEKPDFSNIPNYENIDDRFKNGNLSFDKNNEYCVPYTWGTVGIVYNTTLLDEAPTGWSAFWDEANSGKILMFNNPRDMYAIPLSLLDYSFNTTDLSQWWEATEKLIEQKPLVQAYCTDEIFNKMESGEAALSPCYAGDFVIMNSNNPDLAFIHPKESFNIFIDAICIPKGAANKKAAEEYINFLCSFDAALANAEAIGYSSPVTAVVDDPDYTYYRNEVVYPSDETLERAGEFLYLEKDVQTVMDEGFSTIKRTSIGVYLYVAVAVLVILAVFFIIFRRIKKNR